MLKKLIQLLVFGAMITFSLTNCYEPKKSCLDIEAINFDAGADDTCCCIYPKLILKVAQNYDDLVYMPNNDYEWETGKFFKIISIVYYLSDFSLEKNGSKFTCTDSLNFKTWPDSTILKLPSDFALIRRSAADYPIGTFIESGTFDAINFTFGINESANKIISNKITVQHPLRPQAEKLWLGQNEGYAFARIEIQRDSSVSQIPDTMYIANPEFQKTVLRFPTTLVHKSGYNFKVNLKVDYKKWFEGANLLTDDIPTIKSKIVSNLSRSFDVSQ
jgi:hypothetical protein